MGTSYEIKTTQFFPKIRDKKTDKTRTVRKIVNTVFIHDKPVFDSGEHKITRVSRSGEVYYTRSTKPHRYERNWKTMTHDLIIGDEYKKSESMTAEQTHEWLVKYLGNDVGSQVFATIM